MVNNMDHGLPKFTLLGYDDWKIMMEAHLYALHDCMWMVLEDGSLMIQMENPERDLTNPDVVRYILKPKEKWDDRDCKKHNLENVAKVAIFKTLDPITFSKIKHLKTAMEIWQGLGKLIPTSENLFDKFKKMMEDFEEINLKYSSLIEENKLLSEENLKLTEGRKSKLSEITQLKAENECLSEKVKSLNKELGILKSKEVMDKLLKRPKKRVVKDLGLTPPVPKGKGEQHSFLPNLLPNPISRKEATKYPGVWYLDSGCSRHMTGDASLLSNLIPYDGPRVTFGGSNDFGLTKGLGNLVYKGLTIQAVSYVEGLNYNLPSISQFCVKEACLITKGDTKLLWLWHKRLSHLNFKTLNKLSKEGLVEDLPKAVYKKESICDVFQKGKQVKSTFKAKPAHSTTRILSLIHMDLFGPVTLISLSGKKYVLVVVEDYSRYMWTIFLNSKKETQVKLTNCMKLIQNQARQTIQKIRSDKGTEFLNEIIIHYIDKPSKPDHEVLDLSDKDEQVNEGDKMKPTKCIPFGSLPLKTSQRNLDSESAEPNGNHGQPCEIPNLSHGDNSGNECGTRGCPLTTSDKAMGRHVALGTVGGANVHFKKFEAKCSSPAFYKAYREMIEAQELSEFLHLEILFKYEEEVLEFYRNGKIKTIQSKKNPQRSIQIIESTVGGTKVKISQKKMKTKLHLPNSGIDVGKLTYKNLDWNKIGISRQVPSGQAKKADLKNDYNLVLELVIACLECGSGGHADDIT
ncbi:unnamed protein product [Cuscuta campestris]|uniref:Integrase catalytic domain-containing protein n=1 Tax=Cuscuta campestris TaxID=132261 RepID=A0A484MJW0_9ASTE|nr:unnamed protein product [Cuscuta campestris]